MSGTRKLEKFELEPAVAAPTRKVEKFITPVAAPSPAMLAGARRSLPPAPQPPHILLEVDRLTEDRPTESAPTSRSSDREPSVEKLRTRLARKFTTLADDVTDSFADFHIGAGAWTVELTAPEGMSTSGGKAALQHLRLRPTRQGYTVIVGGVVNPVTRSAELRDYASIGTVYRARFGAALEISAGEWEQFLRKAEVVLGQEGIRTLRVSAAPDVVMPTRDARSVGLSKHTLARLALGAVVFLAMIAVWRVILVMSH